MVFDLDHRRHADCRLRGEHRQRRADAANASVLISTPLRGDEIVRQLFAGVRRLITVLWIPFATVAGYEFWFHLGSYRIGQASVFERLICRPLRQMAVYPFLIGWMTFYLGTRVRSALWAILGSLFTILTVILLPYAGALAPLWMDARARELGAGLRLFEPGVDRRDQ